MAVMVVSEEESRENKERGWKELFSGDLIIFDSQLYSQMDKGHYKSMNYLFWRKLDDETIEVVPLEKARSLQHIIDGGHPLELVQLKKSDLCQINPVV